MSHYYTPYQETPFAVKKISAILRSHSYTFFTAPGVFSKDRVDFGTKVLVESMEVGSHDAVLDLGCGIGIVGRVAADITEGKVVLVDVNERAVKLAAMNTDGKHVDVLQSDGFAALGARLFDVILFNPPQTAGKKLCLQLIEESKNHLRKGGSLQLVARHNVGGATFEKHMRDVFRNVETLAKKGGYRVYLSIRT